MGKFGKEPRDNRKPSVFPAAARGIGVQAASRRRALLIQGARYAKRGTAVAKAAAVASGWKARRVSVKGRAA